MAIFQLSEPWWHYAARGALTYVGLLVLMRLSGKRTFGEMSAFDMIVLVLVGGTLRGAITGNDASLSAPFIGVTAILACDKLLGWACARSRWINRLVEGLPTIVARNGRREAEVLRRQNVPEAAFDRTLHEHGMEDESSVKLARLEPNGKITFIREN
jgi:uncharacterized membrane protein YcaP (DUF421 family)